MGEGCTPYAAKVVPLLNSRVVHFPAHEQYIPFCTAACTVKRISASRCERWHDHLDIATMFSLAHTKEHIPPVVLSV